MKKAETVQKEIIQLTTDAINADGTTPQGKRFKVKAKKRIAFLKVCMYYIQSNPAKEFCEKERDRIINRINMFMENYKCPDNLWGTLKAKHKRDFEKDMGIPKIRMQLSTLNFILN